jgi:hypothetical protein
MSCVTDAAAHCPAAAELLRTSSAANFSTAVNGASSGTLNLQEKDTDTSAQHQIT